jgi:acyl-CoA synthetase (AMP-forming)/AMP-acid ligase II
MAKISNPVKLEKLSTEEIMSSMDTGGIHNGEIIHRGDHVFNGYWRNSQATQAAFKDGWFYSGDMATFDEDGYIYFMDRKNDMIISGGYNIWPSEVENVLYQHPAILEAAVVAVPDDRWGEAVKAVVVLKSGEDAPRRISSLIAKNILHVIKHPRALISRLV